MIRQLAAMDLSTSPESFDYWADQFEKLPMYFQTFYGSTDVTKILNIIDYSIYAHNVTHIVLDNLQFMLSGQGRGFERFELQDDLISKLRTLATEKNVHISLVIHPKKTDDGDDLSINSIFGTSKSTQESDNIYILQNRNGFKIIDIKKNRFDGEIGKVALAFDKDSKRFETINNEEVEMILAGTSPKNVLAMKKLKNQSNEKSHHTEEVSPSPIEKTAILSIDGFELNMAQQESDSTDYNILHKLSKQAQVSSFKRNPKPNSTPDSIFEPKISEDAHTIFGDIKMTNVYQGIPESLLRDEEETFLVDRMTEEGLPDDGDEQLKIARAKAQLLQEQLDAPSNNIGTFNGRLEHNKWILDDNNSPNFYTEQNVIMTYDDIIREVTSNKFKKKPEGRQGNSSANTQNSKSKYSEANLFEDEFLDNFGKH
jgi:hypothetical protein